MAYQSQPGHSHRQDSALSSSSTFHNKDDNPTAFGVFPASFESNSTSRPHDAFQQRYKDDPSDATLPPQRRFTQSRNVERLSFAPPKSTGDLRLWRHDERGNMWTRGPRGRVIGRFVCCTLMIGFLLIISIVLTLALWARPPNVTFNGLQIPTTSSAVTVQQNSLDIALQLSVSVENPNYFGATLKAITAKAFYPPLTAQVGGGALYNIDFPSNSLTNFLFPFNITYSTSVDPQQILVKDLVNKCGIQPGSTKQPLTVNYDISIHLRILAVTIPPSFSGSATFDCPVTRDDLLAMGGEALLQSLGVD